MDTITEATAQQRAFMEYYKSVEHLETRISSLQAKIKKHYDYSLQVPEDVTVTAEISTLTAELTRLQDEHLELMNISPDPFSATDADLESFKIKVRKIIEDNRPKPSITITLTPEESAILKRLMYTAVQSAKILETDEYTPFAALQLSIYNQITKQFNHDNITR